MQHKQHNLVNPVPGTHRQVDSFVFGPEDAEQHIYIQAALHADELPGMLMAWTLKRRLADIEAQVKLNCKVTIVPVANPIGLDQQLMDTPLGRYDMESLNNFNRGYADISDAVADRLASLLTQDVTYNRLLIRDCIESVLADIKPKSTFESLRLTLQKLSCRADYIIDLHCDFEAVEHLYTTPQSWPVFEDLARYFGSKANLLASDSGGQSFDEYLPLIWMKLRQRFKGSFPIDEGIHAVTLELRGQSDVTHSLAKHDAQAIIDWMTKKGLITGEAPALPELAYPATELAAMDFVHAPIGGMLVFHTEPGTEVEAGQVIADIIDPLTDHIATVRAPQSGMLYARNQRRMATAGMIIADIAGQQSHRNGYLLAP